MYGACVRVLARVCACVVACVGACVLVRVWCVGGACIYVCV